MSKLFRYTELKLTHLLAIWLTKLEIIKAATSLIVYSLIYNDNKKRLFVF